MLISGRLLSNKLSRVQIIYQKFEILSISTSSFVLLFAFTLTEASVVAVSNTKTQEGLLFLHCIRMQHLSCPLSLFIPSVVTGHWQSQTPVSLSLWWPFWLPVSERSLNTETTHALSNSPMIIELLYLRLPNTWITTLQSYQYFLTITEI